MKKSNRPELRFVVYDLLRWLVAAIVSVAIVAASVITYNTIEPVTFNGTTGGATADGEIIFKRYDAPEADLANGVVSADAWASIYPEIVASYHDNANNATVEDYLTSDPYLVNIYEGYGFAKDYNSAIGHEYCLEDLGNTARPHALANCLTCKTADFTALVNTMGADAYSLSFDEVYPNMTENVGCYTCHENQAGEGGKLVVTHDYIINGLGENMSSIDDTVLSCGQCHIEYYFAPDNKATSIPYTDVAGMSPDAILAYYNEIGFSDWTQESTGAALLKAQHPEMETFLGEGSKHASMGMNCASCHMEVVTTDAGKTYTSHELVSPLDSPAILATCAACHGTTDITEKVRTLQGEVKARETEVGNALSGLNDALTDAVASGAYSEDELATLRDLYRSAQWYFDFDYVENSEGAHNSQLAYYCLDTAQGYIDQANALFHQ